MLKIGEFSKIAQVSVKALRYYDQLGLLKPAHIDRFTGYRYYTLTQLPELNHILLLKDLDFTLEQILSLRKLALTSEVLHQMLNNKANELRERLSSDRARLCRLENHLDQLERSANATYPPVVLKTAPDYLIATVRETLPTINLLSAWQENQLSVIHRFLKFNGLQQAGPDLLIYHQDDFREVDVDVEVGAIIRETSSSYADNLSDEPIRVHILPGAAQIATTVLNQMPGTASEIYASLTQWTQANGFRPIGPWRELTYEQYSPEAINLFEVQRPVKHADQFYSQLEERPMEPKIMTKPGFTMMGLRYFGKNEKGEVSDLWQAFNQQVAALGGLPYETGEAAIGLCITPENAAPEGAFEYVAGFPVSQVGDIPEGFIVREVPEHTYAVFAHKGDLAGLEKTYEYIYEVWLPQSDYVLASKMDMEYYNEDFKFFAPDSVLYIFIPVEKA